ncbi:VOC family protein [Zooshikella harenae]|uniref:VOC family protein n=1 Tax=Zooshikella harenae TaxID=2827238 RepID=A0ABS5ZBW7_9GAMM|nr:VOC family protein [Zooshikella harenae]MBU2710806.1 VOC family protein [Zooshikella harenae]
MYTLNAVRIFTYNFSRALDFYKHQLGLPVENVNMEAQFAVFNTGETKLVLETISTDGLDKSQFIGRFTGISLLVKDMRKTLRRLKRKHVKLYSSPEKLEDGMKLIHVYDPDQNILTLVSPH